MDKLLGGVFFMRENNEYIGKDDFLLKINIFKADKPTVYLHKESSSVSLSITNNGKHPIISS